jgi:hypothetical protein
MPDRAGRWDRKLSGGVGRMQTPTQHNMPKGYAVVESAHFQYKSRIRFLIEQLEFGAVAAIYRSGMTDVRRVLLIALVSLARFDCRALA